MHARFIRFDKFFGLAIKKLPAWLQPIMKAATLIGQPVIVVVAALTVACVGIFKQQPGVVIAETLGLVAFGGNTVLKHVVRRTRPDTLFVQHMKIKSYSFPSGHAFGSMAIYGLLAYLAYKHLMQPWNTVIMAILALLILCIGVSRVYLEAHFPSDVMVGWLLGGACLLSIVLVVNP